MKLVQASSEDGQLLPPDIVFSFLESQSIDYKCIPALSYFGPIVNCNLVYDEQGPFHLISAGDRIFDPLKIAQTLKRRFKNIKSETQKNRLAKFGLSECPGIPNILQMETIVDIQLLWLNDVVLPSGNPDVLIHISGEAFTQLCEKNEKHQLSSDVIKKSLKTASLDEDKKMIKQSLSDFTKLRIKERLEETVEFPPLPTTAQKILALSSDPDAGVHDLVKIIEVDPALAAQVVSWASAPYYGAAGQITSVHDAITRVLGYDLMMNLAIGLILGKTMSMPKDQVDGFTKHWEQAIYVATTVEALVALMPPEKRPSQGKAYLAGLLHNFGYLVLAELFPPHFSAYCRFQEFNKNLSHVYIEKHLLNVSREQISAWLLDFWMLPKEVVHGVRYQFYTQYNREHSEYANLISVALHLLKAHHIGNAQSPHVPQNLLTNLGIDLTEAENMVSVIVESSDDVEMMAKNIAA